ncbi:MAG: hypothetical protein WDN48_15005 [Pseudolabrys sp.]
MVEDEFDRVWKSVLQELEQEKKTFADENTTEEKAKAEYHAIAERRVRLGWCSPRSARRTTSPSPRTNSIAR